MAKLALRHCTPIKKGTKPISASIARSLIKQLNPGWSFSGDTAGLEQEFHFKNFHETMGFVNAVAWIANTEDHHPDLEVGYNRCKITFTTHTAGGLTVNDFICADKVDALYQSTPEATAERTQAIIEPRAKTGATPRPELKSPELNMSEAEELLNIEIKAPAPEPTMVNEEYEIKLTDPDDEPTLPHLHNPPKTSAPIVEIEEVADDNREPVAEDSASATDENEKSEGRFLKTIIIPPGMQRALNRQGKDEESTVISQPDLADLDAADHGEHTLFALGDEDEVKTMVITALPDSNDDLQEENPDMMKTMIMKPQVFDDDDDELNSGMDETILFDPRSPDKKKSE